MCLHRNPVGGGARSTPPYATPLPAPTAGGSGFHSSSIAAPPSPPDRRCATAGVRPARQSCCCVLPPQRLCAAGVANGSASVRDGLGPLVPHAARRETAPSGRPRAGVPSGRTLRKHGPMGAPQRSRRHRASRHRARYRLGYAGSRQDARSRGGTRLRRSLPRTYGVKVTAHRSLWGCLAGRPLPKPRR